MAANSYRHFCCNRSSTLLIINIQRSYENFFGAWIITNLHAKRRLPFLRFNMVVMKLFWGSALHKNRIWHRLISSFMPLQRHKKSFISCVIFSLMTSDHGQWYEKLNCTEILPLRNWFLGTFYSHSNP